MDFNINNNNNNNNNNNVNPIIQGKNSFSAEEVSTVYQRWQQMEKQYGQNAHSMPEYVQLTQYLRAAARYKQQQQQQQQQRPSPINNLNIIQNNGNKPASNTNNNTRQQLSSSVFSDMESMLLKAQITAFKCLINHQQIPLEITQLLSNNSNIRLQQQQQQQQIPNQQQQPPKRTYQKRKNSQVKPQQPQPQAQKQPPTPNSMSRPQSISQQPMLQQQQQPQQAQQLPPTMVTPIQAPIQPPIPQQPRIPQRQLQPPVKLNQVSQHFNTIKSVIHVDDPTIQVESFSVPTPPKNVTFEMVNSANSRMLIPGLFPQLFDIDSAVDVEKLINNLKIDYTLKSVLETKDSNIHDLIDYQSLKLLPLQKAMRGHIVSVYRHQNSLLTNTHPNFLAKTRAITVNDVIMTNQLYEHQVRMAAKIEQSKKIEKLNFITQNSNKWMTNHAITNEKFFKLGKSVAAFHLATEKEELKRIERNAKQRLQALRANDEELYIKLLDQTKDTRITHLLKQTNSFLGSLAQAVKLQQKDTLERLVQNGHVEDEEVEPNALEDDENIDYYSVAHRIQETVTEQPSILVGGTLKEYQLKGLQWMVSLFNNHLNGILADEMGLGKTIQTISLLTYLVEIKKIQGPFLVIVPLSTLTNWNLEFEKWAPSLKKITYKGVPLVRKSMQYDIKAQNFQVLLTTFEYIIKDRPLLSKIKWVHMIIDEGHRMKNAQSKLSYTLTSYYHSDYRLILTGTPLQNNLPELWAILNFVLPKIFNSVKSFDEWFNTPFANTGGQEKIELSEEETLLVIRRLHKVLRPFLLRRLKKDVEKDLPDKVETVVRCKMSSLQEKLYQQMLKYNKLFIGDGKEKAVGVKGLNNQLMQLRKICNHPFVFEEIENMINPQHETNQDIWRVSGKFELLDRVLPKFKATGHRVLIFFQMTQVMDIMEDFLRLRDMKYLRLDGSTKADDRQDMLRVFNAENSEYFAFLLSTRAGGLGLNLQTADTVIIFDSDWNPHQDLQAQDRAHRIGQKNEVRILRLITENSIEEMILERAHQKLDIDGKVIQAGKFDNKSTAEEQELLLRALLEAEENKKDGDDEMNEHELNEVLARSANELVIFDQVDADRQNLPYGKNRLFSEAELPDIYNQDPAILFQEEVDTNIYGRGAREHKATIYDELMTELEWLKQIQLSSDSGEDDSGLENDQADEEYSKPKRGRKRKAGTPGVGKRLRKITSDNDDEESTGDQTPLVPVNEENFVVDDDEPQKRAKTGGKRAVKTAKRGPGAGFGRGRGKSATPISRVASTVNLLSVDERVDLQQKLKLIYESINSYEIAGRRLSDIFLTKPARRLYPDYYQLIKYPIAFDMIQKRISKFVYNNLIELMEDIHLMFVNAKTYNQEGSLIFSDAITLEDIAIDKYKELTGETSIDFSEFDSKYNLKVFDTTTNNTPGIVNGIDADMEPAITEDQDFPMTLINGSVTDLIQQDADTQQLLDEPSVASPSVQETAQLITNTVSLGGDFE